MRILVAEDDLGLRDVLVLGLEEQGYHVDAVERGDDAIDQLKWYDYDVAIVDWRMPGAPGIDVVAWARRQGKPTAMLMLTARDTPPDRIEGLDAGADDYLVKPFDVDELLARLRALLRRRPPRGSASLVVGDLQLNPDTHEVRREQRPIDLTQREFELLEYLMRNERIVVPRQRLLEEVWGYDPFATTNTIEVFVSNLRRKLEAGGEPRLLHTIRGAGYVLRA